MGFESVHIRGNKRQNKNVKCFVSLLLFSPFFLPLFIIIQDRTIFIVQQSIYLANIVPYYGALCFNNNNKWQKLLYYTQKNQGNLYIWTLFACARRHLVNRFIKSGSPLKEICCACVGMKSHANEWILELMVIELFFEPVEKSHQAPLLL